MTGTDRLTARAIDGTFRHSVETANLDQLREFIRRSWRSSPDNPDPTKEVRYGEPTYDEMMIGYIDYIGVRPVMAKIDPKIYDAYVGRYEVSPALGVTVTRVGDRCCPNRSRSSSCERWMAS